MTDWDPRKHARNSDPWTSREAARRKHGVEADANRLLAPFGNAPNGLTHDEAAIKAGMSTQDASKRQTDLRDNGWIVETGTSRPSLTGRLMQVHRITEEGRRHLNALRRGMAS